MMSNGRIGYSDTEDPMCQFIVDGKRAPLIFGEKPRELTRDELKLYRKKLGE